MTIALALDVSHHSGELSIGQFTRAKERGVQRVIVGVAPASFPIAGRQIAAANAAGLEVEAYIYYYFAQNTTALTEAALSMLPAYVKRVWVDVEDSTSGKTPSQIAFMARGEYNRILSSGRKSGIYTAKWFWDNHMQGLTVLSDLPLWDAWWNDKQGMAIRPYGGWNKADLRQIKGDMFFNDIWCDLNVFEHVALDRYNEGWNDAIKAVRTALESVKEK